MTPQQKENYRWEFAGKFMQGFIIAGIPASNCGPQSAIYEAEKLITQLEATAPNRNRKHPGTLSKKDGTTTCTTCGFEI